MTLDPEIQRYRSNHSKDLVVGVVASILLHSALLLGANNWLQVFNSKHKQASEPIPIEFIELPPAKKATPPPKTVRRAARDSVAGGTEPKKPVSALRATPVAPRVSSTARSTPSVKPRASSRRIPAYSSIPKTSSPPKPKQPIAQSPNSSAPKPQPKRQTIATAPASPVPKPLIQRNEEVAPKPPTQRQNRNLAPSQTTPPRVEREAPTPPRQARASQQSGAASRLGGPISLSSRKPGSNSLAALPNSNRLNQGPQGVDARRDVDMGAYLAQLQQRVRRQWLPGASQTSKQTVLYFAVNRNGQVRNLRVAQPSGSSSSDEAAIGAVQRAAPFAPLPAGYPENSINIRFTFNINVYGDLQMWAR